jgi:hypothetical protein
VLNVYFFLFEMDHCSVSASRDTHILLVQLNSEPSANFFGEQKKEDNIRALVENRPSV